jgi:dihydroorotase
LTKIAHSFPQLRIVLEHATTSEAVEAVLSLPSNVACSITAHHLELTIDAVPGQPFHFCKPIAKEPKDRDALRKAVSSGNPKFFLGSDSAPHPVNAKTARVEEFGEPVGCAAGVYTSSILVPLVATLLESFGALDKLQGFVSDNGRKFYGLPAKEGEEVVIRRAKGGEKVPGLIRGDGAEVVPFWAGKELGWEIV